MRTYNSRMRGRLVLLLLLAAALCIPESAAARRRRSTHANPHAEITALAEVSSSPRRTRHENGRSFEELEIRLVTVDPSEPPYGGFSFDTRHPIRLVHDLTCGGSWVDVRPGDRVDLRGEYVHTPDGRDLVHFTHPAGAVERCGTGSSHPDGYLREHRAGAAAEIPEKPASREAATAPAGPAIPSASLLSFRQSVRPILSTRCAPCHEPGGKMYARLPFDDAATVANHAGRMGTRLKGDDLKTLQAWAAEVSAAASR